MFLSVDRFAQRYDLEPEQAELLIVRSGAPHFRCGSITLVEPEVFEKWIADEQFIGLPADACRIKYYPQEPSVLMKMAPVLQADCNTAKPAKCSWSPFVVKYDPPLDLGLPRFESLLEIAAIILVWMMATGVQL
ncbi:hypothetical protein [Bythopirellula polymerisocia]|uniref:Uncharacterized protein n=1 Tax=Bythopirellula polymerisocia TaxID=2528003 RepID=A0A5C6C8A8_9BACT|nr:hypothetical protein [Bythopirellula polymerisocia]TWU20903.1 hypothetical protein Pla144_48040 [Bythopirellula polymerisocia]